MTSKLVLDKHGWVCVSTVSSKCSNRTRKSTSRQCRRARRSAYREGERASNDKSNEAENAKDVIEASTGDIEVETLDKVEQANQSTDKAAKKVSEVDTSTEAVEACIAVKILAEKRVKELEKEAEEYRNTIAVTNMFFDCFKERMARKYGYDYDYDTSFDDSDSEDENDKDKEN